MESKDLSIKKRDGRLEPFNIKKISTAIMKAASIFNGTDVALADDLADQVYSIILSQFTDDIPTVEQVQDTVEKVLIENGHASCAKEYILYRAERTRQREAKSNIIKSFNDLLFKDSNAVDNKRENANIDANTSMGTMLKFGSESAKTFYESCLIPSEYVDAHKCGDIHIHDEDFYGLTTTCTQIDLTQLFDDGFTTGTGYIREPNKIESYSSLACIAIQCNQNEQHGGQSIAKFDYDLAKGVTKTMVKQLVSCLKDYTDSLTLLTGDTYDTSNLSVIGKEYTSSHIHVLNADGKHLLGTLFSSVGINADDKTKDFIWNKAYEYTVQRTEQSMEALVHNLNTMRSRAGAQVPFSSINFGTDTSEEGRLVTKSLLKAVDDGMGNHEVAEFPITIFKTKTGVNFNKEDKNYDLYTYAKEVSARRLYPNFVNLDAEGNKEYYKGTPESEAAQMGCRTAVLTDINGDDSPLRRGNLSFTSINLPRLAIESKGDIDKFFELLDSKLYLCKRQLLHRFKIQCNRHVYNYPFLMGQGLWLDSEKLDADDTLETVLKHGTMAIGFIGLAETLVSLIGKHHGESEEAQKLGLRIVSHMREMTDKFTQEEKLNFGVLATPAEGLSGRFLRLDKEKYGIIEGVTDKDYYTNSSHVPVYYPISIKKKIDIEAPYHKLENGGHIGYVEIDGDTAKNLKAFSDIVDYMHDAGMRYYSINHPVDYDPVCGYRGIINDKCPRCGRSDKEPITLEHLRKIESMYGLKTEGYLKVETLQDMEQ